MMLLPLHAQIPPTQPEQEETIVSLMFIPGPEVHQLSELELHQLALAHLPLTLLLNHGSVLCAVFQNSLSRLELLLLELSLAKQRLSTALLPVSQPPPAD